MSNAIPLDDDELPEPNTGRQVHDDERRLLDAAQSTVDDSPTNWLRLTELAERLGIGPQRARQLGRTWSNEGLYAFGSGPGEGLLTEAGREADL